jgi:glycosyltransferase involved in cell wall biosynthesis
MLRVLHCIYDDPGNPWLAGGGAVRVFEIYKRLLGRLREVTIATGSYPGARGEIIDGVRYVRLGARRPYAWSRLTYSIAASRLLARQDYDVAVYDFSTYTPLRLPRNAPIGVTVHHLTEGTAIARWGPLLGRFVIAQELVRLRSARLFSATSDVTKDRLRELLGPSVVIHSVLAGVPDELFALRRREQDYLLYFGRLDWFQKGLDTLLDAMAILVRERAQTRLVVAGRGKDGDRLLERSRQLGLSDRIVFEGSVDDRRRAELLAGAQLLLMPSRFEGFGMAAAEAMAAGVPVVATTAGSLPQVVDPPQGGVLVPPEDAAAFAAAILQLLQDDEERSILSDSARKSAERFRWDHIADEHMRFIEAIAAARASRPSGRK